MNIFIRKNITILNRIYKKNILDGEIIRVTNIDVSRKF